jgi:hypothetical protein
LTRPLPLRGDAACGVGRNGGRGAKAPTMRRPVLPNLALSPMSASRSKPARILGLKENAAADGIWRFAAVCMSARCGRSFCTGPQRRWSAARRCALPEPWPSHGHVGGAATTMLRLAALHLPSPFIFIGEAPAKTHALWCGERFSRACLKCVAV